MTLRRREYESKYSDYIYRNKDDTIRVKIFKRQEKYWDADVFFRNNSEKDYTWSPEMADRIFTKNEMKKEMERLHGKLFPMGSVSSTLEGW